MTQLSQVLPTDVITSIRLAKIDTDKITEIKLKQNMPIALTINGQTIAIKSNIINQREIEEILLKLCKNSMAAFEDEIAQGFVTIDGGHRVGIGGEFYLDKTTAKYILRQVSSLNIRIARENVYFLNQDKLCIGEFKSVLLAGAPHSGKTSLAKCCVKELCKKYRVVICDERNEIADENVNCDVIRGVSKSVAIGMATRTLNPQLIVCDEIGSLEETKQILSAINTGVKFICTAHGESLNQLEQRPNIALLLQSKIFEKIVFLKQRAGDFYIEEIVNV